MLNKNFIDKLFNDIAKLNVLVIGDVMIDSYIWGKVDRISPEAPVPVVSVTKREERMGGAANVALNIKSMGANPILCSIIGNDAKADVFKKLLGKSEMTDQGIFNSDNRITTTKFRVIGNNFQMLRIDEEVDFPIDSNDEARIINFTKDLIENKKVDVIIIEDYNKGIVTEYVIKEIVAFAQKHSVPVSVDPKKNNFLLYKNTTLFKPNIKELKEGFKIEFDHTNIEEVKKVAEKVHEDLNVEIALITMSEAGVLISRKKDKKTEVFSVPSHVLNIADVSGAGDTVISVASLCLALNCDTKVLAQISNLAGGLVCEEVGVVPVSKPRLKQSLHLLK